MRITVTKDLTPLKLEAEKEIARRANLWRAKFVTPNKDGIYIVKRDEGQRWMLEGQPEDLADYPWIANEVGTTAENAHQLVQLWINLNDLWLTVIGPGIEKAEMGAKTFLRFADTPAKIQEAVDRLSPNP